MHREAELLLYKGRPARVKKVGADGRLEIDTQSGESKTVRPKDVVSLHPGPVTALGALELTLDMEEVETAWELLQGEETDLPALAQLIFSSHSPASSWSTWQLVADGLYFSGTPDSISPRSPEAVAEERRRRHTRESQKQLREAFLQRMRSHSRWAPEDEPYMRDLEKVARGGGISDPILRQLGRAESPEGAHALLLETGWWQRTQVPYPQRFNIDLSPPGEPAEGLPVAATLSRVDLTSLPAFAIDDEGNRDPDDAIGLDGDRLWVHVADVAACVGVDSPLDHDARARASTVYLPDRTIPMLPAAVTQEVGMGLGEVSPALSFGIDLDEEGGIGRFEIVPSMVRVERLTYAQAEASMLSEPLRSLRALTDRSRQRRGRNGAAFIDVPEVKITVRVADGVSQIDFESLPPLSSRDVVSEAMILAGEAAALYCSQQSLSFPFTAQPPPNTDVEADPEGLAGMFALRRRQPPSRVRASMDPHSGLGLKAYARVTSPLRRYLDLVAHQQLRTHLAGGAVLDASQLLERVGPAEDLAGDVRRVERLAKRHWACVHLMQSPDWSGAGILVDKRGPSGTVLIPALGLQTQLHLPFDFSLNSELRLRVKSVDLPRLDPHFAVEAF